MTYPTQDILAELKKVCDAATEGPWAAKSDEIWEHFVSAKGKTGCDEDDNAYHTVCYMPNEHGGYSCAWGSEPNAQFIAQSRTALPRLIDALTNQNQWSFS